MPASSSKAPMQNSTAGPRRQDHRGRDQQPLHGAQRPCQLCLGRGVQQGQHQRDTDALRHPVEPGREMPQPQQLPRELKPEDRPERQRRRRPVRERIVRRQAVHAGEAEQREGAGQHVVAVDQRAEHQQQHEAADHEAGQQAVAHTVDHDGRRPLAESRRGGDMDGIRTVRGKRPLKGG